MKKKEGTVTKEAKDCLVRPCGCDNAYQDKVYGKGNRVFNQTREGGRCTTCAKEFKK